MPFGGLLTVAGIGAGGSLLGGILGAGASQEAAQQYQQALYHAQDFMQGEERDALSGFDPYKQAGQGATVQLQNLLGTQNSGLLTPWNQKFTAPTAAEAEQTPGYQFQLGQGENAMQNSAAGRGSLLTGRTLADLNNYAQGTASSNYQNVFNNDLTQYQSAYNSFLNNQNNMYSRLMGVSGQGLQANEAAGQLQQGFGSDIASLIAGQGAAQAGGTIGKANAWSGALSGMTNSLGSGYMLSQLGGGGGYGDSGSTLVNGGYIPGGQFDPGVMNSNYPTMGVQPPSVPGLNYLSQLR